MGRKGEGKMTFRRKPSNEEVIFAKGRKTKVTVNISGFEYVFEGELRRMDDIGVFLTIDNNHVMVPMGIVISVQQEVVVPK